MSENLILLNINQHIATLTLNDPERLNAIDETMGKLFKKTLGEIAKNKEIRVLVITGAGRAFSSGGNLDMIEAKTRKSESTNKKELKMFYRMFLEIRNLPIPVIAALNGPAVGAGFCMSLASDLRYAARTAKLGANFAKLGLAPGMGGTYLVTRLIGPIKAAEVLMLGENMSAERAYELDLLNGIEEPENLMIKVMEIAEKLSKNAPIPLKMIKKGIQMAMHASLEKMFDYDSACQAKTFKTQDIKEGIRAIREKRAPVFIGK